MMGRKAMTDIKQKLVFAMLILMIILAFCIIMNSNFVKAGDNSVNAGVSYDKYYKCIALEYGDTLWGIAAEYKGSHYESTYDYIDEVIAINHLTTDKIHAGQYLTIPYYSNCNEIGY